MQIEYFFKNFPDSQKERFRAYLNSKLPRLQRLLKRFKPEEVMLKIEMEQYKKKNACRVSFLLSLPGSQLFSQEDDHTWREAVDLAEDKLRRQLRKRRLVYQDRRHYLKSEKRRHLTEIAAALGTKKHLSRNDFFQLILPLVKAVNQFIRQEIDYLEASGDLISQTIQAEEIVDEAIINLFEEIGTLSADNLESRFYQLALSILNKSRQEQQEKKRRETLITAPLKQEPAFLVSNLGDEVKDFWQPDDWLTLADQLASLDTPALAEPLSNKEQKSLITQALQKLPQKRRQALSLYYLHGLDFAEIAIIQQRQTDQVKKDVRDAEKYLRRHLTINRGN